MDPEEIAKSCTIVAAKADKRLGIVMGYLFVSKDRGEEWMTKTEAGEDYFDLQGDNIPEDEIVKAAFSLYQNGALGDVMHDEKPVADIVFLWPFEPEVMKAMDMHSRFTGLGIGFRPRDPKILDKVESGELATFSLGGFGRREEA